jgi:hypothetical protein
LLALQKEARTRGKSVSFIFCFVLGIFFVLYFHVSRTSFYKNLSGLAGATSVALLENFPEFNKMQPPQQLEGALVLCILERIF